MKGYKRFSELVSLLGNISSVASCVLAAIGVTNIVYLTNETKEIVKEIKVEKELKKEFIHDTIFIEKPNIFTENEEISAFFSSLISLVSETVTSTESEILPITTPSA